MKTKLLINESKNNILNLGAQFVLYVLQALSISVHNSLTPKKHKLKFWELFKVLVCLHGGSHVSHLLGTSKVWASNPGKGQFFRK